MDTRIDTDSKEPYWKVKDTVENLFFNQKFPSSFEAHQFANLENGGWYPPRYVVVRFSPKSKEGKGWHGDTPGHKEAALKGQAGGANNQPMTKTIQNQIYSTEEIITIAKKRLFLPSRFINQVSEYMKPKLINEEFPFIKANENGLLFFKHIGNGFWEMRDVSEDKKQAKQGHFVMMEDRMGFITLSHTDSKRVAFFQAESDTDAIKDLLKKSEKEDLEQGYEVQVKDSEPRASVLSELWEASGGD